MNKLRVIMVSIAMLSALVLTGCAGLFGMAGGGSGSASLKGDQDKIVMTFDSSVGQILLAQSYLLEALGLKEEAAKAKAGADSMKGGNTSEADKKAAMSASESANASIKDKMAETSRLSAKQAETAKMALKPFAMGNLEAAGSIALTALFLKNVTSAIQSNPTSALSMKSEFAVGMYIATALPGYVKANGEVLSAAIDLLKKSGVDTSDIEEANEKAKNAGPQE